MEKIFAVIKVLQEKKGKHWHVLPNWGSGHLVE